MPTPDRKPKLVPLSDPDPGAPDAGETGLGVVVRVDRGAATVLPDPVGPEPGGGEPVEPAPLRASWGGALLSAAAQDQLARPCAGDRVRWRRWPDGRVTLEEVCPRRTLLLRSEASTPPSPGSFTGWPAAP